METELSEYQELPTPKTSRTAQMGTLLDTQRLLAMAVTMFIAFFIGASVFYYSYSSIASHLLGTPVACHLADPPIFDTLTSCLVCRYVTTGTINTGSYDSAYTSRQYPMQRTIYIPHFSTSTVVMDCPELYCVIATYSQVDVFHLPDPLMMPDFDDAYTWKDVLRSTFFIVSSALFVIYPPLVMMQKMVKYRVGLAKPERREAVRLRLVRGARFYLITLCGMSFVMVVFNFLLVKTWIPYLLQPYRTIVWSILSAWILLLPATIGLVWF